MTPVEQDKFCHSNPYGGGNCLQAAVASLFNLPLEAVPHFMLFGTQWLSALTVYIISLGHDLTDFIEGEPPRDGNYYLAQIEIEEKYSHAVIWKDGEIAHDPHPVKGGFDKVEGYYLIAYNPAQNIQAQQ